MPKNPAGMKEKLPLELKWATFCREILSNAANSDDSSLIGLLNGLNFNIEVTEPRDSIEIPLSLWVHAVFNLGGKTEKERKHSISAMISGPGRDPVTKVVELVQKPNHEFLAINMQLLMNVKGSVPQFTKGRNLIKISFRYKSTDLGMIELPVDVSFTPAEKV